MIEFKKDKDVIKLLLKCKNHKLIPYIKDINSFIHRFDLYNCDYLLKMFAKYPHIQNKYKNGLLKQIYRFINLRPKIILYAKNIVLNDYEYTEFIWKCLLKSMNIVPYIDTTEKLIHKIFSLKEQKVNEFIYNVMSSKSAYITEELILKNINKYPRLIYLSSEITLQNAYYIKQILHKVKHFECKYTIILNFLFDNGIPIIHNYEIIEFICNIDCRYINVYTQTYHLNLNLNTFMLKKLLFKCACCLKHYNINYKDMHLVYDLVKININTLDFIDLDKIKNKDEFCYNCCDIDILCFEYFLESDKYLLDVDKIKKIVDINYNVINCIKDQNIKNKLIIYYYQNGYFINNDLEYKNIDLVDIKNFHIATYKKNILPTVIKKKVYSYLYDIEL